ncbi:unnamed protein product [Paramecium sonneborni]|uniref:Uncharacterized protein n=1 Tax=Paramecium sonneborni TaxID=65129 RepID=A0A8S1RR32_9CILI|nr:unnamed protein product [Paramecium sonneborni]
MMVVNGVWANNLQLMDIKLLIDTYTELLFLLQNVEYQIFSLKKWQANLEKLVQAIQLLNSLSGIQEQILNSWAKVTTSKLLSQRDQHESIALSQEGRWNIPEQCQEDLIRDEITSKHSARMILMNHSISFLSCQWATMVLEKLRIIYPNT